MPKLYASYESATAYWRHKAKRLSCTGVARRVERICCQTDTYARVGLRSDSAPDAFRPHVLPTFPESLAVACGGTESERLQRRERVMNGELVSSSYRLHGFRFLALPSDFMCHACQKAFVEIVDIEALSATEVQEWCAKMECVSGRLSFFM